MGSFADSIKANIKELQQEVNDKITTEAAKTFRSVVSYSPSQDFNGSTWATGWVINQWYPKVGSPSAELNESRDQAGMNSVTRIAQLIGSKNFLNKDNSIYLTNNVPYVYQVEALGWAGTKAYAMVDKALDDARIRIG
jgi:hypothetical protein